MLTLQFVPYDELNTLGSEAKLRRLLGLVKESKIVLMEGRLKPAEEAQLIEVTMSNVNKVFRGIELCTIYPESKEHDKLSSKLKTMLVSALVGDRQGLTIIGPATVIKEIKRDPNKIQLLTDNIPKRRTKRKR